MSYTQTLHRETYPALTPSPRTFANKTVLITGAGAGIGRATAHAFASAGAAALILIGRRPAPLANVAAEIAAKTRNGDGSESVTVTTHALDVRDAPALAAALRSVGRRVDVAVHAAATPGPLAPLATADLAELWTSVEINVLGALVVARAVVAANNEAYATDHPDHDHDSKGEAVIVMLSSGGVLAPPLPGMGGYMSAKAALPKMMEYFGAENAGAARVVTVHPGAVRTDMALVAEAAGLKFEYDDMSLSADFIVWAATEDAAFLRNKFVLANWDVDELKARRDEIEKGNHLTLGLHGLAV